MENVSAKGKIHDILLLYEVREIFLEWLWWEKNRKEDDTRGKLCILSSDYGLFIIFVSQIIVAMLVSGPIHYYCNTSRNIWIKVVHGNTTITVLIGNLCHCMQRYIVFIVFRYLFRPSTCNRIFLLSFISKTSPFFSQKWLNLAITIVTVPMAALPTAVATLQIISHTALTAFPRYARRTPVFLHICVPGGGAVRYYS